MNPKILSSNSFSCTGFQAVPAEHGVTATILPHFGPENGCLTRRTFPTSAFILLDMTQIGQTEGPILGRSITLGNCCWIVSQVVFTSAKMIWCATKYPYSIKHVADAVTEPNCFHCAFLGGTCGEKGLFTACVKRPTPS